MVKDESYSIQVKWVDKFQFVATDHNNHAIIIDTSADSGGEDSGLSPMRLLLSALGACTGMDIVSILRKQRQEPTSFRVLLKGERNQTYPMFYKKIQVHYLVKGANIKPQALERAIKLSREKYCSVEATLTHGPEITSSYEIVKE